MVLNLVLQGFGGPGRCLPRVGGVQDNTAHLRRPVQCPPLFLHIFQGQAGRRPRRCGILRVEERCRNVRIIIYQNDLAFDVYPHPVYLWLRFLAVAFIVLQDLASQYVRRAIP